MSDVKKTSPVRKCFELPAVLAKSVIIAKKNKPIQDEFRGYLGLLKYWRDIAAHGKMSGIKDPEAYTSLALLLRFAQFANDRWDDLITDE